MVRPSQRFSVMPPWLSALSRHSSFFVISVSVLTTQSRWQHRALHRTRSANRKQHATGSWRSWYTKHLRRPVKFGTKAKRKRYSVRIPVSEKWNHRREQGTSHPKSQLIRPAKIATMQWPTHLHQQSIFQLLTGLSLNQMKSSALMMKLWSSHRT